MIKLFLNSFLVIFIFASCGHGKNDSIKLWVGTYTKKEGHVDGKGSGIYKVKVDVESQSIVLLDSITDVVNPSFIDVVDNGKYIVAVNEIGADVTADGLLSLFNAKNGQKLDVLPTRGFYPCHVQVNNQKGWFTNYAGGVGSFEIQNGQFKPISYFSTPDKPMSKHPRQEGSHPHSTFAVDQTPCLYIADLGLDRVYIVDSDKDTIEPIGYFKLEDESGPRHMKASDNGDELYVVNELNNTLSVLTIDQNNCSLTEREEPLSLAESNRGYASSADLDFARNMPFLYVSVRGVNELVTINTKDWKVIDRQSTQGKTPRNLMVSRNGQYILVGNQDSSDISVFKIDNDNGMPQYLFSDSVPTPVCLVEVHD